MSYNILITGASGEFGQLATLKLIEAGHTVVASMRDPSFKNKLSANNLKSSGALIIDIDVSNNKSVKQGVEHAIDLTNGIDVVINNAGVGAFGIQETFTDEDWQKIFDVNVFGVQRINKAILPHMRSKKSGLIIYISSLIGRMVLPYWGVYSASKWALEAMAECYRLELSHLGIESCIIEPGAFPTTFFENLFTPNDFKCIKSYKKDQSIIDKFASDFNGALINNIRQNPKIVAEAILDILNKKHGERKFRTVVDTMGMGNYIESHNEKLESLSNKIYSQFGIDKMHNQ